MRRQRHRRTACWGAAARLGACLLGAIGALASGGCTTPMVSSRPIGAVIADDAEGTVAYSLPKTMVKIAFPGHRSVQPGEVAVESVTVADPDHTYLLRYKPNPFSEDKLRISVAEGQPFISQVNGVALDKTSEAITTAVEGIARASTFFAAPGQAAEPAPMVVLAFDPHDPAQMRAARAQLGKWGLDVRCMPSCPASTPSAVAEAEGIYARATIPLELAVCKGSCDTGKAPGIIETIASYNASPLIQIPIRRTSFADRETVIDFDQGAVRMVQHDKAADAVAIARLPGAVIGSLLTGLAGGLQNRTAVLNARKDALLKERELLQQRQALLDEQREIAKLEQERAARFFGLVPDSDAGSNFEKRPESGDGFDRFDPNEDQTPPQPPPRLGDAGSRSAVAPASATSGGLASNGPSPMLGGPRNDGSDPSGAHDAFASSPDGTGTPGAAESGAGAVSLEATDSFSGDEPKGDRASPPSARLASLGHDEP